MANITYRVNSSPVIPGATYVKNSPLTHSEIDANFKSLDNDTLQLKDDVGNILLKVDTIEKNVNPIKRKIQMEGDGAWTVSFDGKSDVKGDLVLNQVNPNVGQFGSGDRIPVITVNSKGLITSVRTSEITAVTKSVVFIGDNPPVNPSIGQLWYDSSIEDRGFIWSGTGWVDFCPQTGAGGGNNALIVNKLSENINVDNIDSLKNTTKGKRNTVIGFSAGQNTDSDENTALGYKAQETNINGAYNTSVGAYSLQKNVSSYNTALGWGTLRDNTSGGNNTAVGHAALGKNVSGSANSAFGVGALLNNTTGYNNTAVGYWSLINNTTGAMNTAVGLVSLGNNTTGEKNTAVGDGSLNGNVTGNNNTAMGFWSLIHNKTGDNNTAVGYWSLLNNTTGASNTAFGANSLQSNTTGYSNTAIGNSSLTTTTTGSENTAVGQAALCSNVDAWNNTAVGFCSMFRNTSGYGNTAVGWQSLFENSTGLYNTAIGYEALRGNSAGNNNTAIGRWALSNLISGSGNTSIGTQFHDRFGPCLDMREGDNRVSIAHTGVTNAYIAVAWTVVSDLRDKIVSGPVPHGLEFVNQLKPIQYRFREARDSTTPHGPVKYGFGAQDILKIEGDNPVVVDTEVSEKLKMVDSHLLPILVNAIQELSNEIKTLKLEINALKGNA